MDGKKVNNNLIGFSLSWVKSPIYEKWKKKISTRKITIWCKYGPKKALRKSREIHDKSLKKILGKSWESCRKVWKVLGNSWESTASSLRKSWKFTEKVLRKVYKSSKKVLKKTLETPVKVLWKPCEGHEKSWESPDKFLKISRDR